MAFAPFAHLAEAKAPTAAEQFERVLADLAAAHDYVLVDTPPVAANQAVAAVTGADRVATIVPPGDCSVDSLQHARGRLDDVGSEGTKAPEVRAAPPPTQAREHPLEGRPEPSVGFTEIWRLAGALGLPNSVRNQTCALFASAQSEDLLRGRSIEGFAAAAVYAVCRTNGLSRTLGVAERDSHSSSSRSASVDGWLASAANFAYGVLAASRDS